MRFALLPSLLIACATPKETTVEFENLPPFSPIISFSPVYPKTIDNLIVELVYPELEDPDGDPVNIRYDWYRDDEPQNISGDTVFASLTTKGERWTLRAYTTDGELNSMPSEASVTIRNTPPAISGYTPSSLTPSTEEEISISNVTVSDADEEPTSVSYRWLQNGIHRAELDNETIVPSDYTRKADTWTVELTPYDSTEAGPTENVSFTIENTAPVVISVSLAPTDAYETSIIEAVIVAEDIDEDTITFEYNWLNNGLSVSQDATLDGSFFKKGEEVTLEVVASDGLNHSDPFSSDTITVLNSPPTLSGIEVSPSSAYTNNDLTCTAMGPDDVDGDDTAISFSWEVNGIEVGTDSTLSSALFAKEDLVRCTVQISDTEIGQSLSESITILNTIPVAGDISITDPVTLADIVYCEASSSDIDQDNLIHEYIWYVNGAAITHTNSFLNASSSFFNLNADDEVYCTATPFDGSEYGATLTSAVTTLLPAEISVNGSISFHGYPVGGIDIVADTYPITTAHSSDADGTYNLSVPTLSGAILSLDIHNETLPSSLVLDIDNGDMQMQDFEILTATFPLAPDQYESDNGYVDPYNFADSMQSSTIVVDEALQYRTLYPPGDEDWIAVDLVENTSYTFFTTLLYHSNDTTLFLYDAQGAQLAYNDNFLGNSSLIQDFIAPSTGTYFLKVDTYETQDLAFYLLGAMQTIDDDGDTIPLYFDCDDQSSAIEPFASEIYNDNIDQDCDGIDLIDPSNLDSVEAMGSGYAVSIPEMKTHIGEHIYRSVSGAYSLHSGQDIDLFSVEIPAKSKALVQVDLHGSTHTIGLDLLSSSNTLLQSTTSQDDLYIENNSSIAQLYYIYTRNDIDEIPVNYNIFWFDFGTDNDLDGYYSMDWNAIRDQNDADPSVY